MNTELAYPVEEIKPLALAAIKKHKLVVLDQVHKHLPCCRATFYSRGLAKDKDIKEAINLNKVDEKTKIRSKLFRRGDTAGLIALYRLLGTEDELRRLSSYNNNNTQINNNQTIISRDFEGLMKAASAKRNNKPLPYDEDAKEVD